MNELPIIHLALAQVPHPTSILPVASNVTLGQLLSRILVFVFGIAGIIAFVWALIGAFQYITSGGNKEGLAKARGRITWAFVGLLFLMISFALANYVNEIFNISTLTPPPIRAIP